MIELVVATRNPGKLRELQDALAGLPARLLSLADFPAAPEVPETGETFRDNAALKAAAIARHAGRCALADDSGLCVDALGGAPGVRSARFAGDGATDDENNRKLLALLEEKAGAPRTARFICVIAVAEPDGRLLFAEGRCEGLILEAPRGSLGFGYDPVFLYPPLGLTFSELDLERKLQVSHRGRALQELKRVLPAWLGQDPPPCPGAAEP